MLDHCLECSAPKNTTGYIDSGGGDCRAVTSLMTASVRLRMFHAVAQSRSGSYERMRGSPTVSQSHLMQAAHACA